MRSENHYWKELKSKLSNEDKLAFNKLVYSEEDLITKATLKNIKHAIQRTKWPFGMFETVTGTKLGQRGVNVPKPCQTD